MLAIVTYMMYLGIAASLAVAGYAFFLHLSVLLILTFIVVFLMGAVPVALPAVLTIVQAATGVKLASEGVLVTRLDSIEDAASISVLCLDKTGTITQNKLSVAESVAVADFSQEEVVRTAALASRAEGMDLIDLAVLDSAKGQGFGLDSCRQVSYTPFSPATKTGGGAHRARTASVQGYKGGCADHRATLHGGWPPSSGRCGRAHRGLFAEGLPNHRGRAVG